jgi:hypothetical protein
MRQQEVESVLCPIPTPVLQLSLSGIVHVQYLVQTNIWVQVEYDSRNSLIRKPEEVIVVSRWRDKHIPLSGIE